MISISRLACVALPAALFAAPAAALMAKLPFDPVNDLWWGVFTAARTPRPVIDKLNAELHKIMATAEMKKRFAEFGAEQAPTTPDAFTLIVRDEIAKWGKVIKAANIKPE